MIETIELSNGVTLRTFTDHRFKQGCLSVQFLRPLCRQEASVNALIPSVLLRGCESAPDLRKITRRLDDLYGASIGPLVRKIGDYQSVGLYCSFIPDRYALQGDQVMEPMIRFLEDLLFRPVLSDGAFLREIVESEKKNLIATLEAQKNDKRSYAIQQMMQKMCSADIYGIPRLGEPELIREITPRSLYAQYQKILSSSAVEFFYVGEKSAEEVAQMLRPLCRRFGTQKEILPAQTAFCDGGTGTYTEEMEVNQARLCLGFTTPVTIRTEAFAAMQVCNAVLGGGMTSKLFMNVREKRSLCYDVSSGFRSSKGLLLITAGVDSSKLETAEQEILQQVEDCREGKISLQELENAKQGLISALETVHDSPGGIEDYYCAVLLSQAQLTPRAYGQAVEQVTVEQVRQAAQSLKLHTRYVLKGVQ